MTVLPKRFHLNGDSIGFRPYTRKLDMLEPAHKTLSLSKNSETTTNKSLSISDDFSEGVPY